jgi:hypothetical protein
MPLVDSQNILRLVTSLSPFTVVTPDLVSGSCTTSHVASDLVDIPNSHTLKGLRGGPAFVRVNSTWLTIAHKRVNYPLGPIYTHFFVFVRDDPWEVSYVSSPFRFPVQNVSAVQDIQFAAGLILKVKLNALHASSCRAYDFVHIP